MNRPVVAFVALGIVASFWILEQTFAQSDHRKAQEMVRSHAKKGRTLEQFLLRKHPQRTSPPAWSSQILSSCRGTVRVNCLVLEGKESTTYRFDIDLSRHAMFAADQASRALLEEFDRLP